MTDRVVIIVLQVLMLCTVIDCSCLFNGETYAIGETWHPPTFENCVNCTCELNKDGFSEVRCVNKAEKCPRLTCPRQHKDPHTCCPYCEVRGVNDDGGSSDRATCTTTDGRVFKDGEQYTSNTTGIKRTSNEQCVMCVCQNGQPLCHLKTCPIPRGCTSFVNKSDHCCPVCADCAKAGGVKKNGTSWHPTVSNFGEIGCITCTCLEGEIKCKKNCVPDHELPCPHPKKPNGECCKTCPIGGGAQLPPGADQEVEEVAKVKKPERKKCKKKCRRRRRFCKKEKNKNKRRCRRRKKKDRTRKQRQTTPLSLRATTVAPGIDLANLCLKRKRRYLVYKAISDSELLIAFDDITGGTVDVYRWKVNSDNKRAVISYTEPQVVQAVEFRKTINNTNVVGTTGKKHYRKFKKRLKEKLDKCNSDCEPEIFVKILQRVKVHLLKFGEECKT